MNVFVTLRGLPRPVGVLFLVTLVNRTGTMALPFLVIYLTRQRHLAAEQAGLVLGAYGAGSLVAGPVAGWLVGRTNARRVMVVSMCGSAAALLALQAAVSPLAGTALVVAWALSAEAFRPAAAAVVAEQVAPEQRRSAYAVLRLAVNLGMAIGPAVGGLLAERSYTALFVVDAATSVGAAAVLLAPAGRSLAARSSVPRSAAVPGASRGVAVELAVHLVGVALVAMVAYQALSTMPLYMTETLGLRESAYGLVFGLSGLIIVLFELPLTVWLERWSHRRLLVCGAALTGIGFWSLGGAATLAAVIATTVVWTAGEMLLGPATAARVAELESPEHRGIFVGLHNAVWSGAFALGPWLGLQLFAHVRPQVHWAVVGLTGLVAAAVFAVRPSQLRGPR